MVTTTIRKLSEINAKFKCKIDVLPSSLIAFAHLCFNNVRKHSERSEANDEKRGSLHAGTHRLENALVCIIFDSEGLTTWREENISIQKSKIQANLKQLIAMTHKFYGLMIIVLFLRCPCY